MEMEGSSSSTAIVCKKLEGDMLVCEDVFIDILSRMPVKQLLQLRTLAKRYRDLICQPYFIRMHLQHSYHNHPEIIVDQRQQSFMVPSNRNHDQMARIRMPLPHRQVKRYLILNSCNGILTVKVTGNHHLLWNPATRHIGVLPSTDFTRSPLVRLEYAPTRSVWGLGFPRCSITCRVVRITVYEKFLGEPRFFTDVLDYDNQPKWQRINHYECDAGFKTVGQSLYGRSADWTNGLTIKQRIYWNMGNVGLVVFDIDEVNFTLIHYPALRGVKVYIMEFRYSLAMFTAVDKNTYNASLPPTFGNNWLEMWVLDDQDSWVALQAISFDINIDRPLYFLNQDELIFERRRKGKPHDIFSYYLYDMVMEEIRRVAVEPEFSRWKNVFKYVESLVPLPINAEEGATRLW